MVSRRPETVSGPVFPEGQGAMCGIAGIMFKKQGSKAAVGRALIHMLDGCQHRLRFIIGDGPAADKAVGRIKDRLTEYQARIVEEERVGVGYRVDVAFEG